MCFVIFVGLTHLNPHTTYTIIDNHEVSSQKLLSLSSSIEWYMIWEYNSKIRKLEIFKSDFGPFFQSIGLIRFWFFFYTTRMGRTHKLLYEKLEGNTQKQMRKVDFSIEDSHILGTFALFLAVTCDKKVRSEKCLAIRLISSNWTTWYRFWNIIMTFEILPPDPIPEPGLENSGKKPQNRVLQIEYK